MNGWRVNWVDYYAVLELDRNAKPDTIKKKYRKMASKYHPDVYDGEDASDKMAEINAAYEVLKDEQEKKEYDRVWDEKLRQKQNAKNAQNNSSTNSSSDGNTGTNTSNATNDGTDGNNEGYSDSTEDYQYQEVNYDDIKDQYTAEERRYAKALALKKIIEEELEKIELILNVKNEIIYSAYTENVEKREFYNSAKELLSIGNEFLNNLQSLSDEAYKYDLLEEQDLIAQSFEFLENELNNMPLTPREAVQFVEKEQYEEVLKQEIENAILAAQNSIFDFSNVLINVYQRNVSKLEYKTLLNEVTCISKDNISKLKELSKLSDKFNFDEEKLIIINVISELKSKINYVPENYDEAIAMGHKEYIETIYNNVYNDYQINVDKLEKAREVMSKHYHSNRYEQLYNDIVNLIQNSLNDTKDAMVILENFKCQDSKIEKIKDLVSKADYLSAMVDKANENFNIAKEKYQTGDVVDVGNTKFFINSLDKVANSLIDKFEIFDLLIEAETLVKTMNIYEQDNTDVVEMKKNLCKIEEYYTSMLETMKDCYDVNNTESKAFRERARYKAANANNNQNNTNPKSNDKDYYYDFNIDNINIDPDIDLDIYEPEWVYDNRIKNLKRRNLLFKILSGATSFVTAGSLGTFAYFLIEDFAVGNSIAAGVLGALGAAGAAASYYGTSTSRKEINHQKQLKLNAMKQNNKNYAQY